MREYLPYILMGVALVALYVWRKGGLAAVLRQPVSPIVVAAERTIVSVAPPNAALAMTTAADAFAFAQSLARHEANLALDKRLADEAVKAATAIYHAPFSVPPADSKPAA